LPGGDAEGVARSAGERLARSAAVLSGEPMGAEGVFRAIGALATSRYEGTIGRGNLTLCSHSAAATEILVTLKDPVPLRDLRTLRKLLEISAEGLTVLTDGQHAFGLGRVSQDYTPEDESHFSVRIVDNGVWQLDHSDRALMRVEHSIPEIPKPALERSEFIENPVLSSPFRPSLAVISVSVRKASGRMSSRAAGRAHTPCRFRRPESGAVSEASRPSGGWIVSRRTPRSTGSGNASISGAKGGYLGVTPKTRRLLE